MVLVVRWPSSPLPGRVGRRHGVVVGSRLGLGHIHCDAGPGGLEVPAGFHVAKDGSFCWRHPRRRSGSYWMKLLPRRRYLGARQGGEHGVGGLVEAPFCLLGLVEGVTALFRGNLAERGGYLSVEA